MAPGFDASGLISWFWYKVGGAGSQTELVPVDAVTGV
jgi:hypothetical protein